jgi:hypothetical protein
MGTKTKVCFLSGMGGRSLVVFQAKKVGFFLIFQGIILLVVWDGVFGESACLFFFCDMVT